MHRSKTAKKFLQCNFMIKTANFYFRNKHFPINNFNTSLNKKIGIMNFETLHCFIVCISSTNEYFKSIFLIKKKYFFVMK